jgi:hypothetical protein
MPELICDRCKQNYPIWSSDNDVWNRVIRDNPCNLIFQFLCPTCFCFLGSNEFGYTWSIKNDRADHNAKVAAPESGVGPNGPSLQPTASAPDCLVGEPAVVATAANKPQTETIMPKCSACKRVKCTYKAIFDYNGCGAFKAA